MTALARAAKRSRSKPMCRRQSRRWSGCRARRSPTQLGAIGVAPAQRKMRVQQLWHWIYVRGAQGFDEMTSISKEMRAQLEQHFTVARPEVVAEQISNDGTRKWLLRLPSGD